MHTTGSHPIPDDAGLHAARASLHSTRLLNAPSSHRTFFRWVAGLAAVGFAALFLPWQQNVQGTGRMTALNPEDRPQTANVVIGGRIEEWFVQEGQYVRRGQPLVRLSEVKDIYLDPRTVQRTQEQVQGKSTAITSKMAKADALVRQISALEDALRLSLEKGRNKVVQYEAAVQAAALDSGIAAYQLDRQRKLFTEGLKALTELEAARIKSQKADATLVEKRNELLNARIELGSLAAEYGEKIAKASSELAATRADVGEGNADVAKLRNTYSSLARRAELFTVRAPQDGYVVRALKAGVGEIVKDGEAIVTVQPATPKVAVELYVKAMDVPLLRKGRKVRLQFDGWPALQFSGWPSVSVGTFGGEVAVIDLVDSKEGKYRVLVIPDPQDEPWPAQLRVGSGVFGWAMLDTVRVWFELWRQLNGFPPTVEPPTDAGMGGTTKSASAKDGGKT
ncbi:MAG: HlyD family efflux transporter periplasmic adaptor subunit [Gemmatimonadaceae bacterium]|nr:HlyD family efflux transporter periplasmic adaptor subunit [Gemmatimonadaceae bacterium]